MTDTMATPDPAAMAEAPMPEAPPMPEQAPPMPEMAPEQGISPEQPMTSPGPEAMIGEPDKGDEIHKIADQYVIPISDEAAAAWKKAGPEEFKKYAEQVAVGLYPTFASQIQAGVPVNVLLDPYVEIAKQTLGPAMGAPNWSDPKWTAALQGGTDPKTGRPIPMSLDQWRRYLMSEPAHGYQSSPQAMDRANNFVNELHKQFGGMPMGGEQ